MKLLCVTLFFHDPEIDILVELLWCFFISDLLIRTNLPLHLHQLASSTCPDPYVSFLQTIQNYLGLLTTAELQLD